MFGPPDPELKAAERPETLQKLFWKARSKARDVLKVQLDDFRAQRAAGSIRSNNLDHLSQACKLNNVKCLHAQTNLM